MPAMIRQLCRRRSSQYLFSEISFGNRSHSFLPSHVTDLEKEEMVSGLVTRRPPAAPAAPVVACVAAVSFLPFFRPVSLVGVGGRHGRQPDHPPHIEEGAASAHFTMPPCLSALRRTAGLPLSHKSKLPLPLPSLYLSRTKKWLDTQPAAMG